MHDLRMHLDLTKLWIGYPETHRHMTLHLKLFFIFQVLFYSLFLCKWPLLTCKFSKPNKFFLIFKTRILQLRGIHYRLLTGCISSLNSISKKFVKMKYSREHCTQLFSFSSPLQHIFWSKCSIYFSSAFLFLLSFVW